MRTTSCLLLPVAAAAVLSLSSCSRGGNETSEKVYELGARAEVGRIIYTVFETQWLPQLGTGDTARVPKNRFFLIRLSAVNSGSDTVLVPAMTLRDDQGNTVEELNNGDGVPQWIGYLRKVAPADSVSGNVVFDAEPKHYQLRVTDENGEKAALIDIPLNFSAETPQLSLPTTLAPGETPDMRGPGKK